MIRISSVSYDSFIDYFVISRDPCMRSKAIGIVWSELFSPNIDPELPRRSTWSQLVGIGFMGTLVSYNPTPGGFFPSNFDLDLVVIAYLTITLY